MNIKKASIVIKKNLLNKYVAILTIKVKLLLWPEEILKSTFKTLFKPSKQFKTLYLNIYLTEAL